MNNYFIQSALWFSVFGSAVVGGVFFAFSTFVMTALGELPPAQGLAAMQAINRSVSGSLFLVLFLATALTALVVMIVAVLKRGPAALPALLGGILFFVGSFVVTVVVNVPLNDSIAPLDPVRDASAELWSAYLGKWNAWNHVRTAASILAMASFGVSLRTITLISVQP